MPKQIIIGPQIEKERPLIKGKNTTFGHVLMTSKNTAYEWTWLSTFDEIMVNPASTRESFIGCREACFGKAISVWTDHIGWLCARIGDIMQNLDMEANRIA